MLAMWLVLAACRDGAAPADPPRSTAAPGALQPISLDRPFPSTLWLNLASPARKQAELWRVERPEDAEAMLLLAAQPSAIWLGGWTPDVRAATAAAVQSAKKQGGVPVFVAYNIPDRDCGQHSAGGVQAPEVYRVWIRALTEGLGSEPAVVILEPDSLVHLDCLSSTGAEARLDLLRYASAILATKPNVLTYLDAGHAHALGAERMADRLKQAGVGSTRGFALNVSNYVSTPENVAYAEKLAELIPGSRYVIDTSRNGRGGSGIDWCNPYDQAIGPKPNTRPGLPNGDAFLWVKQPGESDGECNGGPAAGTWWPEAAAELVRNAQATPALAQDN